MKLKFLSKFGKTGKEAALVDAVNRLEEQLTGLTAEELAARSHRLKEKARNGTDLGDLLVEAFALVREAGRRTLGKRQFDTQILAGIYLHRGSIVEMLTGEGKTLAATGPAYLNALVGKGTHVITVNDYLARRDAVWMGQIYQLLGLKTACLVHEGAYIYDPEFTVSEEEREITDAERDETGSFLVQSQFLRPISRKEAYLADITYGTNNEFGFDYLRDNLAYSPEEQVARPYHFAIIDEVDSILIDEARTPLIIAAPDHSAAEFYKLFYRAVSRLAEKEDYELDEKNRSVEINEKGIDKVEKFIGLADLYAPENIRLVHFLESCLKAKALFQLDRDYVIKNNEVIIVDQFTGRLMHGRRYSAGLHQAIEAKEGVTVREESRTYAQITIQNFFRLYPKISGMTGTAQTSAEEFHKVYGLETISVPTHLPMVRKDLPDLIYKDTAAKYRAIVADIREKQERGQPVLIGTVSIEKNEALAKTLRQEGVVFEMLNAKNHEREGAIIAQAGRKSAVTLATNMAGRGVDIVLGGNPPEKGEAEEIKILGGLHVIGTERHDARRIDNQLRGRSGRQGDPGSSRFFLSLEDDLMRIFGGDRLKSLMQTLKVPEDQPIESKMVSRAVAEAQRRVEGFNFDIRKHLLDYDDVLNKQRLAVYRLREEILTAEEEKFRRIIAETVDDFLNKSGRVEERETTAEKIKNLPATIGFRRPTLLVLDMLWMNHLEDIEELTESVRIRAYGQHDPLVEYRRESHALFTSLLLAFGEWIFNNIFKVGEEALTSETTKVAVKPAEQYRNVGRNDPCPCGSGKKYKKCHGK
jgi:preprotein translocase subunit SecA